MSLRVLGLHSLSSRPGQHPPDGGLDWPYHEVRGLVARDGGTAALVGLWPSAILTNDISQVWVRGFVP